MGASLLQRALLKLTVFSGPTKIYLGEENHNSVLGTYAVVENNFVSMDTSLFILSQNLKIPLALPWSHLKMRDKDDDALLLLQ